MMYLEDVAVVARTVPLRSDVTELTEPTNFVGTLLSISKSTRALSALLLGEIGLHVGQDQLLAALDINKPIAVCVVSNTLNVRPSTVSKMTDRLVAKGLVERGLDISDARRTVLRLTTAGQSKVFEIHALWARLEGNLEGSVEMMADGEIAAALQTIDTVLKKRLSRLR